MTKPAAPKMSNLASVIGPGYHVSMAFRRNDRRFVIWSTMPGEPEGSAIGEVATDMVDAIARFLGHVEAALRSIPASAAAKAT